MNDKERLEEIIFIEQEAKRHSRNNDFSLHLAALKIIYKKGHLNWLIEQAQRVQELETIIEQDERQAVLEGMYEQNKRYREAIENAFFQLTNEKVDYANWKAQGILKEVLEESE